MIRALFYIFEIKKELLVCLSLSVLYVTYYLLEVVKKPLLICGKGDFRQLLENNVPLLSEAYWPTPWCVESRLQTVVASVLRSRILPTVNYRREILRLSDGGQVALDWAEDGEAGGAAGGAARGRPVVLVLPGLTGGSQADYVRCVAAAARQLGARCVVFNNRGLGGVPLTTPRLYCALSHDDLAEVVRAVEAAAARDGGGPLLAVGISLGGLILGHYLAEHGERARLQAALIVSSPLDVVRGSECMERRPLNALLSRHMASNLRRTVRALGGVGGGAGGGAGGGGWDRAAVEASRSVRAFDAAFTTQHFGFASVEQYYRAASLRGKLGAVRVPLLCLCAADDPFQPLDALPLEEALGSSHVALAVTARGGHIGFLEGWWPPRAPLHHYMSRLAAQYFAALLAAPPLLHAPR